jgi:hypothetical protein
LFWKLSDKTKDKKSNQLVILPNVPLSIVIRIAKELNLDIVEKEAYTYMPIEEQYVKAKVLAFESENKEILEKARELLVDYISQRIKDM